MTGNTTPFRVVGAYAAQPEAETERHAFFEAVLAMPTVDGLEISWRSATWAADEPWLLASEAARAGRHVMTLVGAEAGAAGTDPTVGIASPDPEGRKRAVALIREACRSAAVLRAGGVRIEAVELHAYPSVPESDAATAARALERSLDEISTWDWGGAEIIVEHCDARGGVGPARKGLLPLDVELAAIGTRPAGGARVGAAINWGRSAIEEHDAGAPVRHIMRARTAGLLRGVMLSGAADRDGRYGPAWSDVHPPLRDDEPASAMDVAAVRAALDAAGGEPLFVGVKVAVRDPDTTPARRLAVVRRAVEAMGAR